MENKKQFVENPVETSDISRLWGAVADVSNEEQRHHADVTRRLRILEEAGKSKFSDDPMQGLMGVVMLAVVLQIGLPLLVDLIAAWRQKKAA